MWAGRTVWRPGVVIVTTRYIPEHFPEKHRASEHCNNRFTVEHPDIQNGARKTGPPSRRPIRRIDTAELHRAYDNMLQRAQKCIDV